MPRSRLLKADEAGNQLIEKDGHTILLRLKAEKWPREIGRVLSKDGHIKFVCLRDSRKHIFREKNAWGMCHDLIKILATDYSVEEIVMYDEHLSTRYTTTIANWMEHQEFLNFKKLGFEVQSFLPLEYFTKEVRH